MYASGGHYTSEIHIYSTCRRILDSEPLRYLQYPFPLNVTVTGLGGPLTTCRVPALEVCSE